MRIATNALIFALTVLAVAGCSKSSGNAATAAAAGNFLVSPPTGSTLPTAQTGVVFSQTFTVLGGGTARGATALAQR